MSGKKFASCGIVLSILIALFFISPTNFVYAAQGSQMVTNECLQNPEACDDTEPAVEKGESGSAAVGLGLWDYLKMLFALIFVLALLIVVLKFVNKKSSNYQQNSLVRNIGGISVGPQKSVQLLHIGDKLYIVGVGEDVQLIKEMDDPEEVQQLISYFNEKQTITQATPHIMEIISKFKRDRKEDGTNNDQQNQAFGTMLNNRLTEMKKDRKSELDKWKEKERDK